MRRINRYGRYGHPAKLEGIRFGLLIVTAEADRDVAGFRRWFCDCDCGAKNVKRTGHLLMEGLTRSCGCLRSETAKRLIVIARSKRKGAVPADRALVSQPLTCAL